MRKPNAFPVKNSGDLSKGRWRVVIGLHAIREVLKVRPNEVNRILVREGWENSSDLRQILDKTKLLNIKVDIVSRTLIDKINFPNQGIAAEVSPIPSSNLDSIVLDKKMSIVLALDGIEDPQNFGAIIRTSWLFGVDAIISDSIDLNVLTPAMHKVASGGIEHVKLINVQSLKIALEMFKKNGYWIFGLDGDGSKDLRTVSVPDKIVWVLGSEERGMRLTTKKICDEIVSVPQVDNAASYNVSVVAGLILYESEKQRRVVKP